MSKSVFNSCFVKQKQFNCEKSVRIKSVRNDDHLNGQQIQEFYNQIVSSIDESNDKNRNKVKTEAKTSSKEKTIERRRDNGIKCEDIFKCCQNGDLSGCQQWIESGFDVNSCDQYLWTPLMCSCCAGHQDIVRLLLDNSADIEARDKRGRNAYHLADISGHKHICHLIINHQNRDIVDKKDDILKSVKREEVDRNESKMCDMCDKPYNGCDVRHKCSIVHQMNVKSGQQFKKYYEISERNKGFQMLLRSGWSRDRGLGPEGRGMKAPVKTVLKRDRLGFGLNDPKNKRKVTHFGSFDTKAVDTVVTQNRTSRAHERRKSEIRLKQMEINFRQQFR